MDTRACTTLTTGEANLAASRVKADEVLAETGGARARAGIFGFFRKQPAATPKAAPESTAPKEAALEDTAPEAALEDIAEETAPEAVEAPL